MPALRNDIIRRSPEAQAFRAERVVGVATQLASKGGYEGVNMREVAQLAQVGLATLYRYYPSKDALINAAVAAQVQQLAADVQRRPPQQRTPAERAAEVYVRALHAMEADRGFAHAAMSSFHTPRPFGEDESDSESGRDIDAMIEIAASAAWGNDHRLSAHEKQALHMVQSLWNSSVISWLNHEMSIDYGAKRIRLAARKLLN